MQTDRFSRQRILPEIGEEGQRRLLEASYCASGSLSPWAQGLAQRYALASGFGCIQAQPSEHPSSLPTGLFRHTASAEVGLAAICVLSQSLPLFELSSPSD